jgi:hypothetical protein
VRSGLRFARAMGKRAASAAAAGLPRFRFLFPGTVPQGTGTSSSRELASGSSSPPVACASGSTSSCAISACSASLPCPSAVSTCSPSASQVPTRVAVSTPRSTQSQVTAEQLSQSVVTASDDWSDLAAMLRPGVVSRAMSARSAAPVIACTIRGDRSRALAAAADAATRQAALDRFNSLMVAPSAVASQDSLLRTWQLFHVAWFGNDVPTLPLTPEKIYAICSMLREGGYRATDNYLARAKDWHVGQGHAWSEFLGRACRRARRAANRGIGPARQSAALDLEEAFIASRDLTGAPLCRGGPIGTRHLLVCGSFWMMRELELSCAQVKHLVINREELTVSWSLPASKTDVKALGKVRSWGCVCAGVKTLPCPAHAVLEQLSLLADTFGPAKVEQGELPLFPSRAGCFVEKRHVVASIEAVAKLVGEPLEDSRGVRRFGGHSLRVTGARTLAELGIEIFMIQLMARWSSDVVYRYVAEAPLSRMTAAYRRGYAAQAGAAASPSCVLPIACEEPVPVTVGVCSRHPSPWILNMDSGVVHRPVIWSLDVQPLSWKTACGWAFGSARIAGVNALPAASSMICSGCLKAEKAAARACEESDDCADSGSTSVSCAS